MNTERLTATINEFMALDRSSNPTAMVVCYDVNVARALTSAAQSLLINAIENDAYEVHEAEQGLVFKGGGMMVFRDRPETYEGDLLMVYGDDRIKDAVDRFKAATNKISGAELPRQASKVKVSKRSPNSRLQPGHVQ